ncbi:PaaI family thioesterase [Chitinasiproducens palmae]|uniref:Uncharacterized domain 1-containing protein n=1 Tax=Chitinasiproducens palmae TaxID=1770053 RepID=A0A1H2PN23_9BURK|nr:PaaI family thioesterase [Chitinasiproducens palmae]SDV48041.1 uncharacterized domain 1-containing protein [Chitinasiproducens palmae]
MSEPAKHLSREDLQAIFARSPFIAFQNLEILALDHAATQLSVRMPLRPEFERRAGTGQFHGGAIAALIDTCGDFAVGMVVGGGVPTMNLRVDYLRPGAGTHLDATATARKIGRGSAVVDIDVTDAAGKLVAIGRGTFVPVTG